MQILFLITIVIVSTIVPAARADIVATRNIFKGEVLTSNDVTGGASGDGGVSIPGAMIGKEARHLIYKGSVIRQADLGPVTLVNRNDIVTVHLLYGPLEISMRGRSLDAGGEGEVVRIMNLDSRKIFQAKVQSAQIVEVIHED